MGERKKRRVSCTECGVTVAESYLNMHMAQIHGICVPHKRGVNKLGGWPTTYVVSLSRVLQEEKCLVMGCSEVARSVGRLCDHLIYRHYRTNEVVVQEGAELLPCYDFCGMRMLVGCSLNT